MIYKRTAITPTRSLTMASQIWAPIKFSTLISCIAVLSACGDSAEVQSNANNSSVTVSNYTGPAALTTDVQTFKTEFWNPLSSSDRCGSCHTNGGSASNFPFVDLSNVNNAYTSAISRNNSGALLVDRDSPENSRVVAKVAEGHNCWVENPQVCATIIEGYVNNWAGGITDSNGRTISLSAPAIVSPGSSRNFPASALDNNTNSFEQTVYPLLTTNCATCHSDSSTPPRPPFFANGDVASAYEAAKSKIDLDVPGNSRFVSRLAELHNCWSADCDDDAAEMQAKIAQFAGAISLDVIDPDLITSKAMSLSTAILASGGSRYEDKQIALWEFKSLTGSTAYDTSGIEPAMDLTLSGPVGWVLGYGIDITAGGKAQASTESSKKMADLITLTNAYSIEAWVIPGNVSQEDARIVSYSAGDTARNFSLSQSLYNYEFLNRSSNTDAEGRASLVTNDDDEDLQSSLQHVVVTFDPVNGRRIYVNGMFTDDTDPAGTSGGSLIDWNDTYAFVMGNEVSGDSPWSGKLRMVAIHNSALTQTQISQNYAVGVGQKYFMLFSVAEALGLTDTYVLFEVEQYDNTAYLFNQPRFISLDDNYIPAADIPIEGMRIGVNGRETISGQVYGNIDVDINATDYTPNGQPLSTLGTVIAVEKGPASDEFFLTFELLGSLLPNRRVEANPVIPTAPVDPELASDIGVKTFDEINHTMSKVTGILTTNSAVSTTYNTYKQQLPSIENINAFLPSHQMAVAQLAMSYCNEVVIADKLLPTNDANRFFKGFDFSQTASVAFDDIAELDQIADSLLRGFAILDDTNATNNLSTEPSKADIEAVLGTPGSQNLDTGDNIVAYNNLLTTMLSCAPTCNTTARTAEIVKAMCAATLGSSLTIIQ